MSSFTDLGRSGFPSRARTTISDLYAIARTRVGLADATEVAVDVERLAHPGSRARALEVLSDHSDLAGQIHALSRDPWQALWTPGRRTFVPFFEQPFTLLAWRDPVGPLSERALALELFRRHAAARGKHAMIIAAGERLAATARAIGFSDVWIGSEPFFDLGRWDTRGKKGEKLRLACNHARRLGAEAEELFPRTNRAHREAIAATEEVWKAARAARRNDSFLRTAPMENSELRRYFGVTTPGPRGRVLQSFLVCSPVSRRGYYLQDLVRRPDAPRGATELVTLAAMEAFRAEGIERATMGIVPFFDPDGTRHETPGSRVMKWVIDRFDRLYRFSGLQQFRAKFVASWSEPVHVLFWPRVFTPLVAWDMARVLSP